MGKSRSPVSAKTKKARELAMREMGWNANYGVAVQIQDGRLPRPAQYCTSGDKWEILWFKVNRLPAHRFSAQIDGRSMVVYSAQAQMNISVNWDGARFAVGYGKWSKTVRYPDEVMSIIDDVARYMWQGHLCVAR